jgi:hypothetical protein
VVSQAYSLLVARLRNLTMTIKVRLIWIKTERWQKRSLLLPRGRDYAPSLRSTGLLSAYVVGRLSLRLGELRFLARFSIHVDLF